MVIELVVLLPDAPGGNVHWYEVENGRLGIE